MTLKFACIFGRQTLNCKALHTEKLCLGLAVDMATAWRFLMFCFASILCVNTRRLMNRFGRCVENDFSRQSCAWPGGKRLIHLAPDWKLFGKVRFRTPRKICENISTQKLSGRLRRKTRFCSRASEQVKFITEYWDFINQVACAGCSIRRLGKLPSRPTQPRSLHNNFLLRKSHFYSACRREAVSCVARSETSVKRRKEKILTADPLCEVKKIGKCVFFVRLHPATCFSRALPESAELFVFVRAN